MMWWYMAHIIDVVTLYAHVYTKMLHGGCRRNSRGMLKATLGACG